tara:strand:+ start:6278 stop:6553 length:276 start_codon:yes stop_codon:yes gene_type:complete
MEWYFYFSAVMFVVALVVQAAHSREVERIEKIKKKFAEDIGRRRVVPYKDAVVEVFPDGNFIVNGRNDAHCQVIHDEVMESFRKNYGNFGR